MDLLQGALGARLVGIRTTLSGQIAFLLASLIGAISGILIVPITTLYYDTGFLIGPLALAAVTAAATLAAGAVALGVISALGAAGMARWVPRTRPGQASPQSSDSGPDSALPSVK